MAQFDSMGRQIPDPTPVEVPVQFRRPPSIQDEIKRFVRMELSARAQANQLETFEEADDFNVEDDDVDLDFDGSKYEVVEMAPVVAEVDADPPKGSAPKARAPASSAVKDGTIVPSAGTEVASPPSPTPS